MVLTLDLGAQRADLGAQTQDLEALGADLGALKHDLGAPRADLGALKHDGFRRGWDRGRGGAPVSHSLRSRGRV